MSEEKWFENYSNKWNFIKSFIRDIEQEITKKVGIPCKIIEYDDRSIQLTNNHKIQ